MPRISRSHIVFFLFTCSASLLLCIADRSPLRYAPEGGVGSEREFNRYLQDFMASRLPGPLAYRILVPANVVYISNVLRVRPMQIDFAAKMLFLTMLQILVFAYLREFSTTKEALLGLVLLLLFIGISFSYPHGPSVVETIDVFNLLVISAALFALARDRFAAFCVILFVGMLNRETPLLLGFLPLVLPGSWKLRVRRFLISLASVVAPYVLVHFLVATPDPSWWKTSGLVQNIPFLSSGHLSVAIAANVKVLAFLGIPIGLAVIGYSSSRQFLRSVFWLTIPFIGIHYAVGRISELRLWVPLLVIVMPLTLGGLEALMERKE